MSTFKPCASCGHSPDFHRHDDDLLDTDGSCHAEDGHHSCEHFRCLWPWTPGDYEAVASCTCANYVDPDPDGTP